MPNMSSVQPLDGSDGESVASQVQVYLRSLVLDGTFEPGFEFSQVELSRALGVSRTPLREALRMLQEEGLVEAELNRMARVSELNPVELDAVYASRVSLESVAVAMTAGARSSELLTELDALLGEMESLGGDDQVAPFHFVHRRFHRLLVSGAPENFQQTVHLYQDRAERYGRMLSLAEPSPHSRRDREHRDIVAAVRAGDHAEAAATLARHLARTALTVIAYMAPEQDVPATRAALRLCGPESARSH